MRCVMMLAMLVLASAAQAQEAAKPKSKTPSRPKIVKAPIVSETGARYGLLAFGPDAKTTAWLILDGDKAYFDRNCNGDLTEATERVQARKLPVREKTTTFEFKLGEVVDKDGRTTYEVLLLHSFDEGGREQDSVTVRINGGLVQQIGGTFNVGYALSKRAEDAESLLFNGPLTMSLRPDFEGKLSYGHDLSDNAILKPLVPAGAAADRLGLIIALVGTPSQDGTAFVSNQWGGVKDGVYPVADLEFPAQAPGRPPIRSRVVLKEHSCGDGFVGVYEFPKGAAEGPAKLTLSFPDWEDAWAPKPMRASKVERVTRGVKVTKAEPEPKR